MSKSRMLAMGAVAGLILTPIVSAGAYAATTHITGDCGTSLVVGSTIRTTTGTGTIKLKYTNGMGLTNNVALRISPIDGSGDAWAGTAVVGPGTGGTYTLASRTNAPGSNSPVPSGLRFTLNFKAASNPTVDNHWEGDLTY